MSGKMSSSRMASRRKASILETDSEDIFLSPKRKKKPPGNSKKDEDELVVNSLFGELVTKAGFILKKGDAPNLLNCDMAVFRSNLAYSLKTHPSCRMPEIAKEFIKGLEEVIEDPIRLKWSLLYTQTVRNCETARGPQQDSLIRLCLNIDELQPCLIQLLTEKLLETANDDEASTDANIPMLVLANLRWLDYIVDNETLTTKMIEMIEGSPVKVQKEVITYVPDIVNDADHPKLADVLCDLYSTTPELTPAILDTLGNLTLPPESLAEVHHSVLKTLHAARPEQLPVVVKFLLTNTQVSVAYQVLSDIRMKINLPGDCRPSRGSPRKGLSSSSIPSSYVAKDDPAYELLLLDNIKMAALIHKFLTLNWLKVIQDVYDVASVKPIDFLVLLILHNAIPSHRQNIESIMKNKIRTGIFTDRVLGKIFANHVDALKENFGPLKKISSMLMRSPILLLRLTGATFYKLSFLHLDGHYRQETVLGLLQHRGDIAAVRHTTLGLLSTLAHEHTDIMSKFTIFLKGSMELVDRLSMREVKKLVDVVTCLLFSDSTHAAMQDELMILVRKQLCHTHSKYKQIGVVTAALIIKNMVKDDDQDASSSTVESDSARSRTHGLALEEAENLLSLVMSSTATSPVASALFMDELASISLREKMNSKLELRMRDMMADEFENLYVTDLEPNAPQPQEPFQMGAYWNLDADREGGCIALNLAPLVVKAEVTRLDPNDIKTNLIYLAPQFRLLRMLECRIHDGELKNIDALLGCPVICPAPAVFESFDSMVEAQQHAALSCLFYVTNWFRELLNAFVTQKDRESKNKVYQRLEKVIDTENMIADFLPKCPNYMPPIAVFDMDYSSGAPTVTITSLKKGKKGRKPGSGKGKGPKTKGKKANTDATQLGTQLCTQPISQVALTQTNKDSPEKKAGSGSVVNMASLRPFLRELHFDVFNLLFRKLALNTDLNTEGHISLPATEFLLTDLNCKLEHVFGTSNKRASALGNPQEKSIGHSHLDLFTPAEVFEHTIHIVKPVCVHLEKISTFFHTMIADNDGILDAPNMFTKYTNPVMKVNQLLFTTLCSLFSWQGLQQEAHKEVLTLILHVIAKRMEGDAVKSMEQEELISTAFKYFSNFQATVVDMGTAAALVQTLVAIIALPQHEDFSDKMIKVIEELLKREWYTTGGERDKGTVFQQHLYVLLEVYLKQSKEPLKQLEILCCEGLNEFSTDSSKERHSDSFPTLNKNSLMVYYKVIMSFLVSGTTKSLSHISTTSSDDNKKRLSVWKASLKVLHTLVTILKDYYNRQMLTTCLKFASSFLELFLRSAMPLMDTCLRQHNQDVVMLLKDLQTSTRFLQHLCTHSKVKQDTTMTRFVPRLRKSLETLVYRVKAMLALNKCHNAFWMGVLKNRDIHGEEILSQSTNADADEESNEEEEEEDRESDVELGDEDQSSNIGEDDKATDYSNSF